MTSGEKRKLADSLSSTPTDRFVGPDDPAPADALVLKLIKILACELAAEDHRAEMGEQTARGGPAIGAIAKLTARACSG